jgi:uncharacterized protein
MITGQTHHVGRSARRSSLALASGAALALVALAGPAAGVALAQDSIDQPARIISVTGSGRVESAPDLADIQLGVTIQDETASAASGMAAETMTAVIDALRAAGIAETDIQTTQLSLNPVYDWEDSPADIEAWEAANIVTVTLRDVTAIGDIVDAAIAAGATTVNSISFRTSDPSTAQAAAREAAVADAQAKAEQLAAAAGVTITGVLTIVESGQQDTQPLYLNQARMTSEEASVPTPVLPGEVATWVYVAIQYAIE